MKKTLTVKVPDGYIEKLNELVQEGVFGTRSEAIRAAIRLLLQHYGKLGPGIGNFEEKEGGDEW